MRKKDLAALSAVSYFAKVAPKVEEEEPEEEAEEVPYTPRVGVEALTPTASRLLPLEADAAYKTEVAVADIEEEPAQAMEDAEGDADPAVEQQEEPAETV